MSRTLNAHVVLLTLIATLGGLLFGYDTAVISGAVGDLKAYFIDPRHLTDPNAANSLWGIVNSSALIGCIIGGIIGGWVSAHIGRKKGLIIAAVLFLLFGPRCRRAGVSLRAYRPRWPRVYVELRLLPHPRRRRRGSGVHALADVHRRNRARESSRQSRRVEPVCHHLRHVGNLPCELRNFQGGRRRPAVSTPSAGATCSSQVPSPPSPFCFSCFLFPKRRAS